jgi:hypothetical protein
MLSGHRVHHRLIFDNVVPFVYLLCFVAQVLIHLVTRTIVVVLNIGIVPEVPEKTGSDKLSPNLI